MTRIKLLLREPALIIDLVETLVVVFVSFGIALTHDQQAWIVGVVVAALGVAKGFATHPFPVTVITDLGRAILMLAVAFNLRISIDQVAMLTTLLGTVTTLIARAQITPTNSPVADVGGAGAGPVVGAPDPLEG